jgi:glyoxylase-like metal-dependent hydrolase (beta-lactamase superfamily II)
VEIPMNGTWTVTRNAVAPVHTFTAPEEGWLVTSHIIELPTQLLVVDAQYRLSCAQQVVRYATELRKPLSRLYVTHYHPDHLLGAVEFAAPVCALRSVAEKVDVAGDRVAREEHEKVGDDIPTTARRVDRCISEGEEIVDGVRIAHRHLHSAETDDALVIALLDARVMIVQDLVYNRAHVFLGARHFEEWRTALRDHRELPFDVVLPGHGEPGGKALYDEMISYLDFAEDALARSKTAAAFKQRILDGFPQHRCGKILEHELRFLFH